MQPQQVPWRVQNDPCMICGEPLFNNRFRGVAVPSGCGHVFHQSCLEYLHRAGEGCPICWRGLEILRDNPRDEPMLPFHSHSQSQRMEEQRWAMPWQNIIVLTMILLLFLLPLVLYQIYLHLDICGRGEAADAFYEVAECEWIDNCYDSLERLRRAIFRL